MSEIPIGRMCKSELVELLNETTKTSVAIKRRYAEIQEEQAEFERSEFPEKAQQSLGEIQGFLSQSAESSNSIKEFHKEIFTGAEGHESIAGEIGNLQQIWRERDDEYLALMESLKVFEKEFYDIHSAHEKKYKELYNKIEKELLSGATTVSLAKEFNDKAKEFKMTRINWQRGIICVLTMAILTTVVSFYLYIDVGSIQKWLFSLPTYGFLIWMVIYMGNRRAENAKLEEMYKHKEAMAKTFFGYKKSIEELTEDDKNLLIKHMENLLEAIKKDPSNILSSKGEKHFATDIIGHSKSSSLN